MKNNDYIKKYSETSYLTKREFASLFSSDNVDLKWKEIIDYRNNFKFQIEIKDYSSYFYNVVLNNTIRNNFYLLDIQLLKDSILMASLSNEKKKDIISFNKKRLIDNIIRYYQINNVSEKTKENILNDVIEQLPLKLEVVSSFIKAFDYLLNENDSFKDAIFQLYKITSFDNSINFRKEIKENFSNINYVKVEYIENNFNQYISFIEESTLNPTILCLISIFYFLINQPFNSQNEEIAALTCYLILKKKGFSYSSFLLDFSSICFTTSSKMQEKIIDTQNSLDITYFLYYTLPYILQDEKKINGFIKDISKKDDKKEIIVEVEKNILPDFKEELNQDVILKKTEQMLQLYPLLKKKEANFYITHCTIGLNYTISQFQNFEQTVYETARTSMDNLAKLGFYKKRQIGKKFVYTPIILNK